MAETTRPRLRRAPPPQPRCRRSTRSSSSWTRRSTQYRVGDAETAEETTGDAYLEHFEKVEGPLGEEDHEFMEELEHRISTEIRDEMKNGASVADVEQLIDETKTDLDQAQRLLQGG